ncbi:MAG: hypothetical protein IH623_03920 [Verrucomicrobia bacterium]|nr:hypothetical protein [Verrucomicrobiota bacterium]
MIHALKTACTGNLSVVILLVVGYAIYGLLSGLPIDQRFLAGGPGYPATLSGPEVPAWSVVLAFESAVVIIFVFLRLTERGMKGHRLFCVVVGIVGLWGLVFGTSPRIPEPLSDSFSQSDRMLAWYVWCSHLAYSLTGPPDNLLLE